MVQSGQTFKNYKELCQYLGENVYSGNSKKAQMKQWRSQFDYHTEGYKIIIDQIHPAPQNNSRGSNNHANMDIYLPYIHQCIYKEFVENQSMTKLMCDTLHILNIETLKNLYDNDDVFEIDASELRKFRKWIKRVGEFISDNIKTSLNKLQKDNLITYNTAYAFLSQPDRIKYIGYAEGFDDQIQAIEEKVCNLINKKYHISSKISGKQLQFIIFKNKKLRKLYQKAVIKLILENLDIMSALQRSIDEIYYRIDFGSDFYPIKKYWKVWSITEVEMPEPIDIEQARSAYIELIIRKTARNTEIPQKWIDLAF